MLYVHNYIITVYRIIRYESRSQFAIIVALIASLIGEIDRQLKG